MKREIENAVRDAAESEEKQKDLLKILLDRKKFPKFPIEHPFVGCLRENESLIDKNPKLVNMIAKQLLKLGAKGIIEECEKPEKISRQFGGMFQKWVYKLGYITCPKEKFEKCSGVVIWKGSDVSRKEFANKRLNCNLEEKGLDLLVKIDGRYIIGQAKFISTPGGSQDNQFNEAIRFVNGRGNAVRIAVLDGVIWFNERYLEKIREVNKNIFSVLLLKEFIESMR
ncbi:MAG: hypothetical protein QXL15_04510 [Candidatus Korarchaeota archaeon]